MKLTFIRSLLLFANFFISLLLNTILSDTRSGYFIEVSNAENQIQGNSNGLEVNMLCAQKCLARENCRYVASGPELDSCTFYDSLPNGVPFGGLLKTTGELLQFKTSLLHIL